MKDSNLIHIYLEKKFLLAFRIVMLLIAFYFLREAYEALKNGFLIAKGSKSSTHELSFYIFLAKDMLIALLFFWLGTGGSREKKNTNKDQTESKKE